MRRHIFAGSWRVFSLLLWLAAITPVLAVTNDFTRGQQAYEQHDFAAATKYFTTSVSSVPSAGAYRNLGNATWLNGQVADALLAWERAAWVDPRDVAARNNLQFAREIAQLEALDLTWGEIASTWLPVDWWAWLACGSLWFAVSLAVLPAVLRRRKSGWQQAFMAVGLGIFLLSLPANYGAVTRTQLGLVRAAETPLRLTPTAEGEPTTKLAAGEPGRVLRERGRFLLIRTRFATGWIEREKFGFICPR